MQHILEKNIGKQVVLDTRSSWVYIGTLEKVTDSYIVLSQTDVHENKDSSTSKEVYIFETRATGIQANREMIFINLDYVDSFSLLKDVKKF